MRGFPKADFNQNRIRFALSKTFFQVYEMFDGKNETMLFHILRDADQGLSSKKMLKRPSMTRTVDMAFHKHEISTFFDVTLNAITA